MQSLDDVRRVLAELQQTKKRLEHFDDVGKDLVSAVQNMMTGGKAFPNGLPANNATAGGCPAVEDDGVLTETDERFWHGRAYAGPLTPPPKTWNCADKPRKDHDAPGWLTASEFEDAPAVAAAKAAQLSDLLRTSKRTVLYTGAGISAAVVGQAARSGQNTQGWKAKTAAQPTYTHKALGALATAGYIHSWVQQNHDGLPQKAGFPQERINEIHGSWYDPSNPVVKYSGTLHTRAAPWMEDDAEQADLVLVLGTSLSGLYADKVVKDTARRAARGEALGTVIVNLQQTPQDGAAALRLFGKSDDVLSRVAELLQVRVPKAPLLPTENRALVPYDAEGKLTTSGRRMWLDLRPGQKVKITEGHNVRGARQPNHKHMKTFEGVVVGREDAHAAFNLEMEGATMRLGLWWLDVAKRGAVAQLPLANLSPTFEDAGAEADRRRASSVTTAGRRKTTVGVVSVGK